MSLEREIDLSIVVVSWNVAALLRHCLATCYAQSGLNLEVIVVDNASTDGSAELVRREFPQARLIVNEQNWGFPAAVNQGIAESRGQYVMLLNPDAELSADSAATLVRYMDAHPQVGVVGPRLAYADGRVQSSRRRFPTLLTAMLESTPLQWLAVRLGVAGRYYMADTPDDAPHTVDWVMGACMVVRQTAIRQAGAMDVGFFMYSEELDWCRRIKAAGWQVIYLPTTTVIHHEGGSAAQDVARRAINFNVSKLRYWAKWHGRRQARLLRGWLKLLYTGQMLAEAGKWLLGHKRPLRAARVRRYRQLLANGLRRYTPPIIAPKLALLTAEYRPQPGGVGDYTHELASAIGATVLVVGQQGVIYHAPTETTFNSNLKPQTSNLTSGWAMLRDVHHALLRERIDALNIQYQTGAYGMHPAVNLLPLYLKLRGNPARVVVTFHDLLLPYLFPKAGRVRKLANWLLLAFSDAAIVTNAEDAAATTHWGDKVRVIPIGSNIAARPPDGYQREAWRQAHGIDHRDMLIAYFGLLNPSKGLDTLLDALAELPPHFKLAIIGGGTGESDPTNRAYAAQIDTQIERLGLGGRIMRSGQLPEREVSAWLCGADIAALPFRDGASLRRGSLLAALTHGLPTVSTQNASQRIRFNPASQRIRFSGAADKTDKAESVDGDGDGLPQLCDGENLLLVPPTDAAALAKAIQRLADDPHLRARLSAGGKQLAAQVGWEAIGARVREVMTKRRDEV